MNNKTMENMESINCMSYTEESAFYTELQEVENIIKSVHADKKEVTAINNELDPRTNYKLTYR